MTKEEKQLKLKELTQRYRELKKTPSIEFDIVKNAKGKYIYSIDLEKEKVLREINELLKEI